MKKILVSIAVGKEYERLEETTGPTRQAYASRHGWEYRPLVGIPEEIRRRYSNKSTGFQCYMYKLLLPGYLAEYDLVAFMDGDTVLSPSAPCLGEHWPLLQQGRFVAATTTLFHERRQLFPWWPRDYYVNLELQAGHPIQVKDRTKVINAGLLVFNPANTAKRWQALAELETPLNEENRLNIHDVQDGLCHILGPEWNTLWKYEKRRIGFDDGSFYGFRRFLSPASRRFRLAARLAGTLDARIQRHLLPAPSAEMQGREKQAMLECLSRCFMLHLAFEHQKLFWFTPQELRDLWAAA